MNNKHSKKQIQKKPFAMLAKPECFQGHLSISEELRYVSHFVKFLEDYPSNENGRIVGINIKEMCAASHFQKEFILELLELLQEKEILKFSATGDIYDIELYL